ncbi:hypothetical protein ACQ4M3_05235 [Leptolyngbya sp. AN03gr2]|uniref:hypothetical protein n=1 Tax=unclassified Leptolyngbya TaxID=2650499 RepID=UPI003D3144A2
MKQIRATIKHYQRAYVQKVGETIGTDDPTEIISKIITDHQLQNDPTFKPKPDQPAYVVITK